MSSRERVGPAVAARDVLIAHQRLDAGSCMCGWGRKPKHIGRSYAEHVVREIERSGLEISYRPKQFATIEDLRADVDFDGTPAVDAGRC